MSDPSERDEPSFVTNIERSLDPRVPSPLGSSSVPSVEDDDEVEPTEVGTLPGPQLHRLHDDGDEPVENTVVLPVPGTQVLAPMRPPMDSEAAGHWRAPGPNGAPLPISSDTAALQRSELVQPPPAPAPVVFGATVPLAVTPLPTPAFPSAPPPMYAPPREPSVPSAPGLPSAPPRRRRSSAIYFVFFLVIGVIVGAGVALKLGIVRRGTFTPAASPSPSPSPISSAPPPATSSATPPPSAPPVAEAPSAAPTTDPSAAPVGSGRHGRPRRPRRGK